MQTYRRSWVMIRLILVSLISPLPHYKFRSNVVSTESFFQGEHNSISYKEFGGKHAEDMEVEPGSIKLAQIRAISAFPIWLAPCWTSPSCVKCSPSILSHFWQDLEYFWGEKVGSISRILKVLDFVGWELCRKAGEWMWVMHIDGKKSYIGCDGWIFYIPGTSLCVL